MTNISRGIDTKKIKRNSYEDILFIVLNTEFRSV